jgi:glycerophosphoryl diester phosphodiesterase
MAQIFSSISPIIWSHKGGTEHENTLASFEKAWHAGVKHFETDLHLTKDGVLVLSHDSTIFRLTGVNKSVSDLTFSQLQNYPISGEYPWLSLDHLVRTYPMAVFSLDMKNANTLNPLVEFLTDQPRDRFIVGSFSASRIKSFRNLAPDICTALDIQQILKLKLSKNLSLGIENQMAMVPYRYYSTTLINERFISNCQDLEIPIHAWTINDMGLMESLLRKGVTGVVTDKAVEAASRFYA